MKTILLSTLALTLAYGTAAQAQSVGTVGAMNDVARGIATSADDVGRQQTGRSTVSDALVQQDRTVAAQAQGQSPGTVGAAPGQY